MQISIKQFLTFVSECYFNFHQNLIKIMLMESSILAELCKLIAKLVISLRHKQISAERCNKFPLLSDWFISLPVFNGII